MISILSRGLSVLWYIGIYDAKNQVMSLKVVDEECNCKIIANQITTNAMYIKDKTDSQGIRPVI